jgi:acetoin utilization protein AcuB
VRRRAPVNTVMSRLPAEIDRRESLAAAVERMRVEGVRHLPVMDGATLYGVLSPRDVTAAWVREGEGAAELPVGDVCTTRLLTVEPTEAVRDVAARMVERGVTSAIVVDGGVLVGIFTSADALAILAAG